MRNKTFKNDIPIPTFSCMCLQDTQFGYVPHHYYKDTSYTNVIYLVVTKLPLKLGHLRPARWFLQENSQEYPLHNWDHMGARMNIFDKSCVKNNKLGSGWKSVKPLETQFIIWICQSKVINFEEVALKHTSLPTSSNDWICRSKSGTERS